MVVCLLSSASFAGGFAVSEQDAAASGRAGTAIAVNGTASSIHYNPAGLGFLKGPAAQAGMTRILPQLRANDTQAQTQLSVPPHVYAAWGFEKFALGVGFNTPFGGGVKWPDDWFGRTELTEMSLRVFAGHLGGAYRLTDSLSLGASLQLYGVSVALTRRIDFVDTEGTARLRGDGFAIGAQLGLDWNPHDRVHLGLMGRIPATAQLQGRALRVRSRGVQLDAAGPGDLLFAHAARQGRLRRRLRSLCLPPLRRRRGHLLAVVRPLRDRLR